ncbi:MAG TPA: hypothetical protein VMU96_07510 [Casimicrobiaceae bacterium]|nr:hypothetical protein [Casimicrobiaceae bacterium]
MDFTPVLPENIAVDEVLLHRFAKIHAHCKLAILAFFTCLVVLATVVTGHLNAVLGSGVATAAAVLGFFSARRAAALLREGDSGSARSVLPASLREARSPG